MNNKRLCTLFEDSEPNLMLLSEDQIALIGWLAYRGYELKVEIMSEEPEEIKFEDWKNQALR